MVSYSGLSQQDYMNKYSSQAEASRETRHLLAGGGDVPVFAKDPQSTAAALEIAQNEARMQALKQGGSKKKTKHKNKYSKQHIRSVKVRTNTKKRRYARKKDNKKHR